MGVEVTTDFLSMSYEILFTVLEGTHYSAEVVVLAEGR